jgi:hypothetical protein
LLFSLQPWHLTILIDVATTSLQVSLPPYQKLKFRFKIFWRWWIVSAFVSPLSLR